MKKSIGILTHKRLASLLLLVALLATAVMPVLAETSKGIVCNPNGGRYVNIREWGSYDARVLSTVSVGTQVEIARKDGAWYCVWVNGIAGYIHSSFVSTSGGSAQQTATVTAGPINMREAPSMRARVITQLSSGATVTVLSHGGTWTQVRVGDSNGYVMTSNLQFGDKPSVVNPPKPPITTPNANATIKTQNGGNLNLRSWASDTASVIDSFGNGTRVRVLTHGATWCKVQVGNQYGYMITKYLVFDGSSNGNSSGASYNAVVNNPNPASVLHLRKEPSASSKSLGQFYNGTKVKVLAAGTEWLRVSINGVQGYMMAKYVKFTGAKLAADKTVVNNGSFVNLRSGAGYGFDVLKRVSHGSAATVLVPYATWSKVIVKDGSGYLTGFMLNSFLK